MRVNARSNKKSLKILKVRLHFFKIELAFFPFLCPFLAVFNHWGIHKHPMLQARGDLKKQRF
jgi:hypothetical protein